MRTLALAVVLSLSVACGPATEPAPPSTRQTLKAKITNEYAESLFTLTVHVKSAGGKVVSPQLFTETRIEGYKTATADFSAELGDRISFDLVTTSLGEKHSFMADVATPVSTSNSTLSISYDYDLARAEFRARYRWEP